jgi:hypothetical protein
VNVVYLSPAESKIGFHELCIHAYVNQAQRKHFTQKRPWLHPARCSRRVSGHPSRLGASFACELGRIRLGVCDPLAVAVDPAPTLVAAQHALAIVVCHAAVASDHPVGLPTSVPQLLVVQVHARASNHDMHLQNAWHQSRGCCAWRVPGMRCTQVQHSYCGPSLTGSAVERGRYCSILSLSGGMRPRQKYGLSAACCWPPELAPSLLLCSAGQCIQSTRNLAKS